MNVKLSQVLVWLKIHYPENLFPPLCYQGLLVSILNILLGKQTLLQLKVIKV